MVQVAILSFYKLLQLIFFNYIYTKIYPRWVKDLNVKCESAGRKYGWMESHRTTGVWEDFPQWAGGHSAEEIEWSVSWDLGFISRACFPHCLQPLVLEFNFSICGVWKRMCFLHGLQSSKKLSNLLYVVLQWCLSRNLF